MFPDEQPATTTPSFAILESILTGTEVSTSPDAPVFSLDPISADKVYVHSGSGVASFELGDWVQDLLADGDKSIKVKRLVSTKK